MIDSMNFERIVSIIVVQDWSKPDKERLKNQDVYWLKLCNHYDCRANEREESNLKKTRFSLFWKMGNSFTGQWSLRKSLHYNELDSVILEYKSWSSPWC